MACPNTTIDSNVTGARIAEESCPGFLPDGSVEYPGTPVWDALEPNSYSDFGGELTTKARAPISPSRQRKKGAPVDLDATGGYNQDFTETGLLKLMQGFCFANAHVGADTNPVYGTKITIIDADDVDDSINAAAGLDAFVTDDIVLTAGFAIASNNGVKTVASAVAAKVTLDQALTTEVAAPISARMERIGHQTTDLSVVVTGSQITLHTAGAVDFTTLGLVEGGWIFIGSDDNAFADANNQCFARVDTITATDLSLGKTTKSMVVEAATSVDIMLPIFVRNEPDPVDIIRRTYQVERTVGSDSDGVMSEYLVNSVANEFTLNIPTGEFLNADLSFVSGDNEQRTGLQGVKAGDRPTLPTEDAYNTSSDVLRFRLATVDVADPFPAAMFGYAQDGTITINNNVSPNKAIAVLGAFSMTAGTFEVGGSLTVYFANMTAVKAVRENADVTLDMIAIKNNAGWVFDIPLLALGDGRLNVEANSPITLPLEASGAESVHGHTLMLARFSYLPDLASV